jgi:hypothetical protein
VNTKLTTAQIQEVCHALLQVQRRVGRRDVMRELHRRYGAMGRCERVARILKRVGEGATVSPSQVGPEVATLIEQLRAAEERAGRAEQRASAAEEMERSHQDFWANRYAEKIVELQKRQAAMDLNAKRGVSPDEYLRIYRRAAELARRLAQYEPVEPLSRPPANR